MRRIGQQGISEFSYGYAVTEALIRGDMGAPMVTSSPMSSSGVYSGATRGPVAVAPSSVLIGSAPINPRSAPVFPSLLEERRIGYDMRLDRRGTPLVFQFKISDYVKTRSSSPEVKEGLFSGPVYRMPLMPLGKSPQHHLLIDLERKGEGVFYAAPAFHTITDFNRSYRQKAVLQQSIYYSPGAIGCLPDMKKHHVSFDLTSNASYRFSDPVRVEAPLRFNIFREWVLGKSTRDDQFASESLETLITHMREVLRQYFMFSAADERNLNEELGMQANALDMANYIARTYFAASVFVVFRD